VYDIVTNSDFKADRVFRVPFTKEMKQFTPESELGMGDENAVIVSVTSMLNKALGGDKNRPPSIHINKKGEVSSFWPGQVAEGLKILNPGVVEHSLEYWLGGRGKFVNDAYKTARDMILPDAEPKMYNVPVVKRLYSKPGGFSYYDDYRAIINTVRQYEHYYKLGLNTKGGIDQTSLQTLNNTYMQEMMYTVGSYQDAIKTLNESIKLLPDNDPQNKPLREFRKDLTKELVEKAAEISKKHKQRPIKEE
jgi:hypothetical protein